MSSRWISPIVILVTLLGILAACAPAAQPAAAPTKAPAAVPTTAPAPTKAAEQPKPVAEATKPAAAAAQPTSSASKEMAKVKVGVTGKMTDAGFLIGNAKGYYAEQGIALELIPFDNGTKMIAPLATGELDAGGGAPGAGLYNAVSRDIAVRIVADDQSVVSGQPSATALAVRQDLFDAGKIKDYSDLKGLKIGTSAEGNTGHIMIDRALQKGNLTLKDAEIVVLSNTDAGSALASKGIDLALVSEPTIAQLSEKKIAQLLRGNGSEDYYPNQQVAALLYAPTLVKERPEVAKKLMVAFLKSIRDYNDAFIKKDQKALAEIVDILAGTTAIKDKSLYAKMRMPFVNPDGDILMKSLKDDQAWFVAKGYQKEAIDLDSMVDMSFVKYAIQQLGPYKK